MNRKKKLGLITIFVILILIAVSYSTSAYPRNVKTSDKKVSPLFKIRNPKFRDSVMIKNVIKSWFVSRLFFKLHFMDGDLDLTQLLSSKWEPLWTAWDIEEICDTSWYYCPSMNNKCSE
jgi:hypothetical protein